MNDTIKSSCVSDLGRVQDQPLDERSRHLRCLIVRALEGGKRGHVSPAFSIVEIIRVLYDEILNVRPDKTEWPGRDRFILSKGHGCLALYAVLADKGYFPAAELDRFCHFESELGGHPEFTAPGVEASTGALGHGLPIGVGMALAARIQKRKSRIVVLMGDGEINEGSVWEAASCAYKHRLDNLTAIIDSNRMQSAGPAAAIQPMEPLGDKWASFGFQVFRCNGHDVGELVSTLRDAVNSSTAGPRVVICDTVKGKGFSEAERDPKWHHKSRLQPDEIKALKAAFGC